MRKSVAGALLMIFSTAGALAMPSSLTLSRLLDICGSSTVPEAVTKGDALGWQRRADAEFEEWRTHFRNYNSGSVEVVGWRRGAQAGEDLLSFWIAKGPNGHRACSYSPTDPAGFLEALMAHFGTPDSLDKHEFGTVAFWKQGATEVSFSQVGSSTGITIGHND